jgi:hypothetical protein
VLKQVLHAGLLGGGIERLHQAVARRHRGALRGRGRGAGLDERPVHGRGVHGAHHRIADRRAALPIRRLVHEHHAVLAQELECRGAVVGEGADDLAGRLVAIVGLRVRLQQSTSQSGQVLEHEVGRSPRDAVLSSARWCRAQAEDVARRETRALAADMRLHLDHDITDESRPRAAAIEGAAGAHAAACRLPRFVGRDDC